MSDTPRTDAAVIEPRPVVVNGDMTWQPELVYAALCRQLERENAELRKDAERYRAKRRHEYLEWQEHVDLIAGQGGIRQTEQQWNSQYDEDSDSIIEEAK